MIKVVFNRLLRGWYVVRGAHHFPLAGPFATRAEAIAWRKAPHGAKPKIDHEDRVRYARAGN